jgi:hypothetical protein
VWQSNVLRTVEKELPYEQFKESILASLPKDEQANSPDIMFYKFLSYNKDADKFGILTTDVQR